MGGYNEEETPYAWPMINKTIQVGDHSTFGYCDYEKQSVMSLIIKEVIKLSRGREE